MCLKTNYTFACGHSVLLTTEICSGRSNESDADHPAVRCEGTHIHTDRFSHLCLRCTSVPAGQARIQHLDHRLVAIEYQKDLMNLALRPLAIQFAEYGKQRKATMAVRDDQQRRWDESGKPSVYPWEKLWFETRNWRASEDTNAYYEMRYGKTPEWAMPRREVGCWWSGKKKEKDEPEELVKTDHFARWASAPEWAVDKSEEGKKSFFEPKPLTEGLIFEAQAETMSAPGTEGAGGDYKSLSEDESDLQNSALIGYESSGKSENEEGSGVLGTGGKNDKKQLVNKRLSGGAEDVEGISTSDKGKQAEGTGKKSTRKKVVWKRMSPI